MANTCENEKFKIESISIKEFDGDLSGELMEYVVMAMKASRLNELNSSIDPRSLSNMFQDYAVDDNKIIFIAHLNGEVAGTFFGHCKPFTFSSDLIAYETYTWVKPEFRGQKIGSLMLDMFEVWASKKGCKAIVFGVDSTVDKELLPAENMLISSGYSLFEKKYKKVI